MKKFYNRNFAYGAAALLIGAVSFTACSSEDELSNTNPTYDGESVKTQFAINIPAAAKTRMTGGNTQEGGGFLGMYDIKLLPMTAVGNDNVGFTSILSLDPIVNNGLENSHKIYNDVSIPVGTTNFLFYGAGGENVASAATEKFDEGIINANVSGSNTSNISFSLEEAKVEDTAGESAKLVKVLNAVESVSGWADKKEDGSTLGKLYKSFITLKAGSANSICKTLETLYNQVDGLATGGESTEKTIALGIQTAIKTDGVFTVSDGPAPYVLSTTLTYPQNMNMPDGSASVAFADGEFTASTTGVSNGNMTINMADICYPASIYYMANTPLKATDADNITWPTSLEDWTGESAFDGWGDKVLPTTHTIALANAIQYAVAKLALTVKCSTTPLPDKKGAYVNVPDNGFTVTGVLIGGQPQSVKWDFTPSGDAQTLTKTVYDKSIVSGMAAKSNSVSLTNYTLVLDNKQADAQKVNIAIELKNTSTSEFEGADGIIPVGGTFYLIAQLDPAKGSNSESVQNPYVFMQDYTTTANLKISSLANAYNCIPDLRASQLSLGLAVDLTWKTGLSFDIDIQ
ncbi:hypothetical protein [Xylanibacter rarus]|jgi:hypothetical protein|uniref:hypothetical protein n=1 Tax=Xylanibacter rarus TaxID=1676614 RepID=UPI003AB95786